MTSASRSRKIAAREDAGTMREFGTFDYIIVGAGSAGCVLANRLTASGRHRVLLVEAGPADRNPWIHIPIGYAKLFTSAKVNWLYQTEPEPELNNRQVIQPRGKVLGGSSSINGLVYIRGQKEDFDVWRQLGNVGWSWDDVLPYFKKAEAQQQRAADDYHGCDGPLSVSDQSETHELCEAFIEAGQQIGIPRNDDFNGASQEGIGYFQMTSRNGRRCSTAVGYLRPARTRANLTVVTDALTTRIVFEGDAATGIAFTCNGEAMVARAEGEVILASGAINSPQLLQLSGVGPASLLRGFGIEPVRDMPAVGAHLQDHFQTRMVFRCNKKITLNDIMASPLRQVGMGLKYALQRKGPLTVSAGYAGAFLRTDRRLATPDVQVHFLTFSTTKMGEKLHPFSAFTATICQLRPESRGTVTIKSADPGAAPAIRVNYLATENDRNTMIAGLKMLRRISQAPAMAALIESEFDPGPACQSDADWLAFIRERGGTIYHPTCSCKMGDAANSVVDARLRVHGLRRLRVVDGSVMPNVVSGNTNAAVIMIAEKGADMILQDAAAAAAIAPVRKSA
jgi:choline dehydrogenase